MSALLCFLLGFSIGLILGMGIGAMFTYMAKSNISTRQPQVPEISTRKPLWEHESIWYYPDEEEKIKRKPSEYE